MSQIYRDVHIVPGYEKENGSGMVSYLNNYCDWDTYNTFYHPNWFEIGLRKAQDYHHRQRKS